MDALSGENFGKIMYDCPVDDECGKFIPRKAFLWYFKGSSGIEKAACECDKQLAETLQLLKERNNGELKLLNTNYPAENCQTADGGISGELFCCQKTTGSFSMYNNGKFCCEDSMLHSIGSCNADEGIKFNQNWSWIFENPDLEITNSSIFTSLFFFLYFSVNTYLIKFHNFQI